MAPLMLAVCILLVASSTMILFFHYSPLSELVGEPNPAYLPQIHDVRVLSFTISQF